MAASVTLKAADGHEFTAWRADPSGAARGGVVVLHAIYGLTSHIADVCDRLAEAGFAAIAPAFLDRIGRGITLPYDAEGVRVGRGLRGNLSEISLFADIAAAAAGLEGRVAALGFCTGGSWAWIAAAMPGFDAAVIYYGSDVAARRHYTPICPVMAHYGDADHVVPMADIALIEAAHPKLELFVYRGAGHGFFNPDQPGHDETAAARSWQRSVEFLSRHLAGGKPAP
jgi:carboxymethylenebutenolidase